MIIDLKTFLIRWQTVGLAIQFALVVLTTVVEMRRLKPRPALVAGALVLAACTAALTAGVAPRTSRIFYDEQIYQGIGRNLSDLGLAQMCNDGNVEYGRLQCARGEYNKEPYAYPYLISLIYRVAGVSDTAAFRMNTAVNAVSVVVVIALADLLFGSVWISLSAGVAFAVLPMQLTWSHTAAAEPSAAFICGLAVVAAVRFARTRTGTALSWAAAATGFAVGFRPECVLVVAVAGGAVMLLAPDELQRPRLWLAALAGAVVAWAPLLHLVAVRHDGWGSVGPRLGWSYAAANIATNTRFYLADDRFPFLVTAVALAGLVLGRRMREKAVLILYFLAFWTIFVFFYAGSYNYGADVRYSLMSYVPLAVLAGVGMGGLAEAIHTWRPGRVSTRAAFAGIVTVVLVQFLAYLPLVRATGEEAWAARADVRYAKEFAAALPPNSLVLTHNPSMFHVWGISAAQASIAANEPDYIRQVYGPRYAGGIYLHWNFWCNVNDRLQVGFCEKTLAAFPHDLVQERRERTYRYALYRLKP